MTSVKQAARILQNLEERVDRLEGASKFPSLPSYVKSAQDRITVNDSVPDGVEGSAENGVWNTSKWSRAEWQ